MLWYRYTIRYDPEDEGGAMRIGQVFSLKPGSTRFRNDAYKVDFYELELDQTED